MAKEKLAHSRKRSPSGNRITGLTKQQEVFVAQLVKGETQRQAYIKAFPASKKWKPETIDSKASILFKQEKVRERFYLLMDKAADKIANEAIMDAAGAMKRLTQIAAADVMDFVEVDTKEITTELGTMNTVTVMPKDLSSIDTTAIKKITVDGRGNLVLELYSKLDAIKILSELQGFAADKTDNEVKVELGSAAEYAD